MELLNYLIIVAVAICFVQLSVGLNSLDYTKPSKEVGKRLRMKKLPGYPHEYGFGFYYQGDILLRPGEKSRIAITRPTNYDVWPNATVPYEIFAFFTDEERATLNKAFAQFEEKTCVRFVPRTEELQYVTITTYGEGCYSNIGRNSNPEYNMLNLQTPGCMGTVRTPVHEMMHTLGFLHEQSRRDRDRYIQFFPQNLAPEYQNAKFINTNYAIYNGSSTTYGVPYNYGSVMHYSRFAGAATAIFPVLVRRDNASAELGNNYGLSDGDVAQIKARYSESRRGNIHQQQFSLRGGLSYNKAMELLKYLIIVAMAICLIQLSVGKKTLDYTKPSKEVAYIHLGNRLRLKKLPGYPHEYGFGYYYQGDILLRPGKKNRFAVTSPTNYDVWPNATVPYEIEADFTDEERATLNKAFAQFEEKTCVRFVQRTEELEYVTITNNREGCYSYVGRNSDPAYNTLNLQTPSCMDNVGTPVHELMHTLGFMHEQSRRDRDTYIQFFPQNLAPKYQDADFINTNFAIYNESSTTYGQPYDFVSVMHYSRFAAAATFFFPVLVRRVNPAVELGNDDGLSVGDVAQVKARYCPVE
ncbi:zinc metalloproteinase nas-36-like [Anopheles funestus]|uniref:zinc metalloproteinase nas-36-like n=1 Tax=Anopheles funestus TaxID=62324 RepID=UPI0020C5F65D|nr:zinc metalloproteinase nas-36-like [Anopheles funestus]